MKRSQISPSEAFDGATSKGVVAWLPPQNEIGFELTRAHLASEAQAARRRAWPRRCLRVSLGCLLLGLLVSWFVGGALLAPQPRQVGDMPPGFQGRAITFSSESGATLAGWSVELQEDQGVVVLLHGIGGSRRDMLSRSKLLTEAGYSTLLIDLRAHGESGGESTTLGHLERHDVRAAVAFARELHPGEPIAVLGVSLGGAAALLASPLAVDAMVIDSAFSSLRQAVHNRVAARLGPLAYVPTELLLVQSRLRFGVSAEAIRPIEFMPELGCPLFLLSGELDEETTPAETQAMFDAALQPKRLWILPGAGHEDLYRIFPKSYKERVLGFLGEHLGRKR